MPHGWYPKSVSRRDPFSHESHPWFAKVILISVWERGVAKATQSNRRSGNENENRSQQNGEYFQLHLAVMICFFMSCVLKSVSIQKHPDKSKKAPVVFSGSYLSRTGPRSVLDKYDPEKIRWYPKEKDLFLEIKRPGITKRVRRNCEGKSVLLCNNRHSTSPRTLQAIMLTLQRKKLKL